MMTTGKLAHALALAAACALPTLAEAAAPKCEVDRPVVFAGLDWDSNAFHNAIARFITEKGYGCKTEAIPGSTIPLLNGMVRGDIDVTMELWVGVLGDAWEKAKATGNVTLVGVTFDDARQGWFVPRYLVEGKNAKAPGLKSVADLPKYKEVFRDPEEPSKGRFYNGIAGWGAEVINSKKLKVYDLEKDYTNFRPGTGASLSAAIASAYKRRKPILYYYWGPTWVVGKYDGVMLEEPAYDEATWKTFNEAAAPDKATAYPVMKVYTGANTAFAAKAPNLIAFLGNFQTNSDMVSKALVKIRATKGQHAARDVAMAWLRANTPIWTAWVPADVAKRVVAAL